MARLPRRPPNPLTALVVLIIGLVAFTPSPALAQPQTGSASALPTSIVGAYFASWDTYQRGYNVADIPADKINVLLYALAKPKVDAVSGEVTCTSGDPWADWQSYDNSSLGGTDWDSLTPSYHDLVDRGGVLTGGTNPTGQGGFVRYWNQQTATPWLYNPTTQRFVSYDDATSIGIKTQWAVEQNLAGVFAWKLAEDSNSHELLDAMGQLLA